MKGNRFRLPFFFSKIQSCKWAEGDREHKSIPVTGPVGQAQAGSLVASEAVMVGQNLVKILLTILRSTNTITFGSQPDCDKSKA